VQPFVGLEEVDASLDAGTWRYARWPKQVIRFISEDTSCVSLPSLLETRCGIAGFVACRALI
jgi:hypothetical protein